MAQLGRVGAMGAYLLQARLIAIKDFLTFIKNKSEGNDKTCVARVTLK